MASPEPLPITVVATSSLAQLLHPVPGRRMDMPGFDEEFVDFPDYIIRITDRIWHQRKVDLCLDYYSADCVIHTLAGDIVGAQTVVDNTHATLDAFPDRRLEADNVIWSREDPETFYSSHLITSLMTNQGESDFGPATGRQVQVLTIADCVCRDNRIVEEWLVRDNAGLALQLGYDPQEIADRQARCGSPLASLHEAERARVLAAQSELVDLPDFPEEEPEAFARAVFARLWNGRDLALVDRVYDFRVDAQWPGARRLYGPAALGNALGELLTALPDARAVIEHVAHVPYLGGARGIAVRWSLAGSHDGDGIYGPASGAPIFIMGVTQWRVINGQIHAEWTVWDDIAVRRQIAELRLA